MKTSLIPPDVLDSFRELATADDPNFLMNFLKVFLDGLSQNLKKLGDSVSQQNSKLLSQSAHAIKSSCANLEVTPIVELCARLEKLGHQATFDGVAPLTEQVTDLCRSLEAEIRSLPEFKSAQ